MAVNINLNGHPDDIANLLGGLRGGNQNGTTGPKPGPTDIIDAEVVDDPAKPGPKPAPMAVPQAEPQPAINGNSGDKGSGPKTSTATGGAGSGGKASGLGAKLGIPPNSLGNIKTAPVTGIKGLMKAQWSAGQQYANKAGAAAGKIAPGAMAKVSVKAAAKALPVVGSLYAAYSAYQDFKQGDYVGMVLNGLGMIPGPVGWIALGVGALREAVTSVGMWDEPDGEHTFILPAAAKDVSGVKDSDAALRQAQNGLFSFQDGPTGSVWNSNPPKAIRLDGHEVVAAATEWLNGISEHFENIDKLLANSGEQYISEQRQALVPHLTAVAALRGQVSALVAQLTAASDGAGNGYDAVLEANKAARTQLSTDGSLSDAGPATTMKTILATAQSQVAAADDKLTQLFAETPPAIIAARTGAAPGTRTPEQKVTPQEVKPATVTPPAQTPAAQTPAKTETPTKNNDDLSKLLSQLAQQKAQTPSTPASSPLGTGSGLGGGSPLGTGTGQGTGGTPLSSSKPDTKTDDEKGKKLGDDKKLGERKTEEPKKLDDKSLSTPKAENAKAAVPAEAKPAAAVPAPGTPAATAPTPAQQNAAHAAAAQEPNKEVDVKGQKTLFPDAKTAKLASLLAAADPAHPMSLADAAKAAGLTPPVPGQDPGTQVSPADAKPGDIMVAGDRSYMLLGDGKFYDLTEYKVIGASELPQQLGDRAGYFHLVDPTPGQPAAGQAGEQAPGGAPAPQGPVSPQATNGVQHQVPNATGAPTGPVDANAAGTQQPAAPGGVPSTGTPGVPKPGTPGAGPANAAATDTGTGTGGPTTGGGALDPSAVK